MRLHPVSFIQTLVAASILAFVAADVAESQSVTQREERFNPRMIEMKRGQTLVVTNEDPFVHHVFIEGPAMKYDSGEQRPGRKLSITFDQTGEFILECAIHLKMKLKVIVKD
jgi:plastocyanin